MTPTHAFFLRFRRAHLPTAMLITLLQRTPVLRVAAFLDEMMVASPVGTILKSATAAAAALGALNSLAGATTFTPSTASPLSATVGQAITGVAFNITGTQSPAGSWQLTSSMPAGLSLTDPAGQAASLTGAGVINVAVPVISGTPTAAGTYNITLVAWEFANATGIQSLTYTFTVVVSASASAPSFTTSPQGAVVNVGQSVSLTAAAANSPSYQWQKNGANIAGATSATYTIPSPQTSDSGSYAVIATNGSGATTSAAATVTVVSPAAAPVFTVQPISQEVTQGVTIILTASAAGGSPTYQWQVNGGNLSGQTGATVTLSNVQGGAAGNYTVIATNGNGSTTSSTAVLKVDSTSLPVFTTQPSSETVLVGQSASFTVVATGSPTGYQWFKNGTAIAGATDTTFTISSAQLADSGTYTVVADNTVSMTDAYGSMTTTGGKTTSNGAALTVTAVSAPVFSTQPQSQSVTVGQTVTLTAAASGSPAYQWQFNGSNISGQTGATLTLSNVAASAAGNYAVVATNAGGTATSTSAVLTVSAGATAPAFTVQPQAETVVSGTTVVFTVAVSGAPTPSLQWNLNGAPVSGATGARLVVSNATAANAGTYTCAASNSAGTATSGGAALSLTSTTNVGRLINLSVNTFDGSGSQLLTMGFVTGGSGTSGSQTLLVRASGTPLTAYGVPGVLPDPTLAVHTTISGQDTVVASNAGWASTPSNQAAVTAADAATFAYPLTDPTSQDSATVVTLPSNPGYTVQVVGKSGDSGRTLAEIYDDTPGTYTAGTPRLINVSCRIQVGAGSSLTEGFTVGGITSKTVLIRAIGPTLASYGVGGVMPDPQLTVYSGQTAIASNSGWGGDPQLTAAMNAVFAFSLPDPASKDSVVLITLAPGSYTAQASSVSGTAGVTLVEVYEVP